MHYLARNFAAKMKEELIKVLRIFSLQYHPAPCKILQVLAKNTKWNQEEQQ